MKVNMASQKKTFKQGSLSPAAGWLIAGVWGIAFAVLSGAYVYALDGTLTTLIAWAKITAATSALLFAVSLGMSSFSYYFGFPDMRRGYQKYIGILGFWVALAHSVMLPIINPDRYFYNLPENLFTADVALGLIAMLIFGNMVIINTKWIAPVVGRDVIIFSFGLGFVAYALLVLRAIAIEWDMWFAWFMTLEGLPPPRIILSIIATLVLIARISVSIHKERRR